MTKNDEHLALRLYMMNAHISAAMLTDLHFVEIALRNKFAGALTKLFGSSDWYNHAAFHQLLPKRTLEILNDAIVEASKKLAPGQLPLPGKVISELSFGFWHNLTNKRFTSSLWTPAFRSVFVTTLPLTSKQIHTHLETLRFLRNRIAHHEPVFHMDLEYRHKLMIDLAKMLCPSTATVLKTTSTFRRERAALNKFRRRKKI